MTTRNFPCGCSYTFSGLNNCPHKENKMNSEYAPTNTKPEFLRKQENNMNAEIIRQKVQDAIGLVLDDWLSIIDNTDMSEEAKQWAKENLEMNRVDKITAFAKRKFFTTGIYNLSIHLPKLTPKEMEILRTRFKYVSDPGPIGYVHFIGEKPDEGKK